MKSRRRPVVGETLYSLNVGNASRRTPQVLTPVEVVSVGRRYFSCSEPRYLDSEHMWTVFRLDTWQQKTDYTPDEALYESEQEYLDEKEGAEISKVVNDRFKMWNPNLPIEALRQIKAILDANPV